MKPRYARSISLLLAAVMFFSLLPSLPTHAHVADEVYESTQSSQEPVQIIPLSTQIPVVPGQLDSNSNGTILDSDIYGTVVHYELKKGHTLSISDKNYVFSVRKYDGTDYSTMLKQATTAAYTATEDMTIACLIRKPDKSALTAEELAAVTLYDTQYGMKDVPGSSHRFTVEAETIDGGTATTRANIFLPVSYSETGTPTRLIIMTNGYSAYLTDSTWNGNTAENVGVIRNYLDAGYAVMVVNNTINHTGKTPDLGCPQLVDSYFKAYEYVQEHLNVEKKFALHSRSFGTFAAVRIMLERPELVKCAVMTGPRVSIQKEWPGLDKAFIANRFGFADTTGATYEADIMVGHDPYTDVDGKTYALPPTFWMLAEGDATERPLEYIEKLTAHGNDVTQATYTGIDHSGICTLNTDQTFADALAFLESYNEVQWEQGTIASATGLNNANTTRLRTVDYLAIADFGAVTINLGYTMTAFAYDADQNYLGTTSWLGNGTTLHLSKLQEMYPAAIYFRIALRSMDSATITVENIPDTGITFYAPGEDVPVQEGALEYDDVGTLGSWQDGAIWDGKLFVLSGVGTGAVYDLATLTKLSTLTLDQKDILKPHANSVCFGSTYYAKGDKYPLLYVNIYNNYSSAPDRLEGTCCVYRVTEENGTFTTDLVQVIRIGFVEDLTLWKSKGNNGDIRPYGNFLVDTDAQKLYAFVMRDADKTTRFFQFAIPSLTAGTYSEIYGCNVVTLQSTDIESQFDTAYSNYLQGCTYADGKIISAEGFNAGGSAEPALRIVDLATGAVTKSYYLATSGLTKEPEVVAADPTTGTIYYAAADGILRILILPEVHTHTYKSTYTEPTCTEPGYTTHICTACGDTYKDGHVDALGHDYGEWYVVDEDTRQRDCRQCGHTRTFTRLAMPLYYSGEVYVETNHNGLYCGTRNVADLLGLKSGTYTNGDVTITVDGTAITVKGTPTKTLYFDLQAGTFGTPDYKRDPGYSLPDGDYRFGLIGSGTAYPTACIRYPDGVGNLVATSGVIGAADLSGSDFGIPYLYLPTGKTYDFSGQLILGHGSDSTYDGDAAQTEKIEGTGDFTVNGYLWTPGQAAVFGNLASRDTGKLIYTDGSKEYIDIYLPQETGYLQIQMNLITNTSINAYGWRLNMMYACDNGLNKKFPVTNAGEYEAAIKIAGRPDFMGMGAHGSERMTSFTIYIDGAEVTLDQLAVLTDWKSIRIVRESDFYDPLDETTLVATHTVIYDYDLTGLTVTQDVNWLVDTTCITSYMMMFPVRRACEDHQITDTYFDDFDATEYDVSQEGFTTYPVKWTTGATKMTLYSEKSGITASMESLETAVLTGTGYKHCANSAAYNKLYFTICGGGGATHTVTAGDQWHTSHRYEVTLTQGTDISLSCFYGHTPGDPVRENEGPHGSHDLVTYCSICGKELTREHDNGYLPGDINGDGVVNNKDITRLFQYLSDYDVEVVEEALDVNGDGQINNKDLTRLFQYLSDYDVEIF